MKIVTGRTAGITPGTVNMPAIALDTGRLPVPAVPVRSEAPCALMPGLKTAYTALWKSAFARIPQFHATCRKDWLYRPFASLQAAYLFAAGSVLPAVLNRSLLLFFLPGRQKQQQDHRRDDRQQQDQASFGLQKHHRVSQIWDRPERLSDIIRLGRCNTI